MSLRVLCLNLLVLSVPLAGFAPASASAAEETLPPTQVSGGQDGDDASVAHEGVQLEWLEIGLGAMRVEPRDDPAASTDGYAASFSAQLLINEFTLARAGAEHGISSKDGEDEVEQQQYFAGLAFAAPLGSYTRLLLETGWLREDFSQEAALRQSEQGLYAAVTVAFTLGDKVEIRLRSRGDQLFGQRRHDNEISLLLHLTESFSAGISAESRHTSDEDENRLYFISRVGF